MVKSSPKPPQRKRNSAERRRSRMRRVEDKRSPDFRDLIENGVQGVLIHSNFKPLYANTAFAKLLGYKTPLDVMKLPLIRSMVPPEMWAHVEEEYDDLMRGEKKSVITRVRAIRRDGKEIWLSVTERVIDWHGDKAVQINAFDISDQMAVEQVLLKSEQYLRAMLEILPYPIYITRIADGQLLFVNRKTCLLFQQSAGLLLRSKSIDFFVEPQERENLRLLFKTVRDIRDVEVKMKTAQNREFTAEIAAISMVYGNEAAVLVALNDISHRKQLENELLHQANTDSLTGISNRRYFLAQAEQEMRRSRRFARSLSVMMIDLDHFKKVNDQHGHAAGDAVLQGVVKASLESLRQSDQLGRIGGEEFAVILPETNLEAATDVASRLLTHIAERPIIAYGGETKHVAIPCTVSVGLAQLEAKDGSIDDLLHRADEALYCAKKNGRNRVEIACK